VPATECYSSRGAAVSSMEIEFESIGTTGAGRYNPSTSAAACPSIRWSNSVAPAKCQFAGAAYLTKNTGGCPRHLAAMPMGLVPLARRGGLEYDFGLI
jgi:hypothetical protein